MLTILTLIHIAFSLLAIGSGAVVLFGLLTGKLFGRWAVIFLKCSLIASGIGLLVPFRPFQGITSAQAVFMLSVYVAGTAILAWRKFHLAGVWRSVFAVTATIVLYLNVLVFLVRPSSGPASFGLLPFSPSGAISMVTQILFIALFGGLAILAARRFHDGRTGLF